MNTLNQSEMSSAIAAALVHVLRGLGGTLIVPTKELETTCELLVQHDGDRTSFTVISPRTQ